MFLYTGSANWQNISVKCFINYNLYIICHLQFHMQPQLEKDLYKLMLPINS